MAWLASFKGLRGLGIPPLVAGIALAAVFAYKKFRDDPGQSVSSEAGVTAAA